MRKFAGNIVEVIQEAGESCSNCLSSLFSKQNDFPAAASTNQPMDTGASQLEGGPEMSVISSVPIQVQPSSDTDEQQIREFREKALSALQKRQNKEL